MRFTSISWIFHDKAKVDSCRIFLFRKRAVITMQGLGRCYNSVAIDSNTLKKR